MKLLKNISGAALPEYGLLVALIAVIAIAGVTLIGANVLETFQRIWQAIFGG